MHNFKYTLKTLFRSKMLIFWTFAFPIILGTLFYMAFSNIESSEKLDIIDIAIINDEKWEKDEIFKEVFQTLSDKHNEKRLFNTQYVSELKAKELLEENKITGYIIIEDTPKVVIKENGINATILTSVTEEILERSQMIATIIETSIEKDPSIIENMEALYTSIYKELEQIEKENDVTIIDTSSTHLSYTMIEFYTLIAMTCLYGGILGMVAVNQNLANMSTNGKRVAVSPVSKGKLIWSSVLASYVIQIIGITLLFIYTIFALQVDYGDHLPRIVLLALIGCLAGLSLGIMVASCFKTNDNAKTGIIISITMLGCFLSGMMGITMKYVIDTNIPIVNKMNPASMITDALYSLYYYDTLDRYHFNIISLLLFSLIMICLSIYSVRRQKYDSI